MIELAEYALRDLGFHDVRVRHHEMRVTSDPWRVTGSSRVSDGNPVTRHSSPVTHLARIEVGPAEMIKFLADGVADRVAVELKKIGYAHVTLDLQGYRRISMNKPLNPVA